jgi:hypothetical protein
MFSKFLVAFGIAAASTAIASPANAMTWLDIHDVGDSDSFGHSNGWFRGFTDYYYFKTPTSGFLNGVITSLASLPTLDVSLRSISLDGFSATKLSSGGFDKWAFENLALTPGKHRLDIVGYWGKEGGSYSGNLSFSAAAVPEPASWAMMIAGFGLVGAAMRRRTKTQLRYA